jgi:hypothetical protein
MPTEIYSTYNSLIYVALLEHGYSSTFTRHQMGSNIGVTLLITLGGGGAKSTEGIKNQVKEYSWKEGEDWFGLNRSLNIHTPLPQL